MITFSSVVSFVPSVFIWTEITICSRNLYILNAKSGLGWTSNSHTGLPVPVFALGAGQDEFKGFYDNTEIYNKMAKLTKVVKD